MSKESVLRLAYPLLLLWGLGTRPLFAQPEVPVSQLAKVQSEEFQARIEQRARALANEPRLKGLSQQQRQERVEFVVGNMLFVATHEMGHAVISEMDLPVLGPEEDAGRLLLDSDGAQRGRDRVLAPGAG